MTAAMKLKDAPWKKTYCKLIAVMCLVIQSFSTLCYPMDCSPQAPLSIGIFQARILEEFPCPSPRDLPNPGIKPRSPTLQADSLPSEWPGKRMINLDSILKSTDLALPTKVCIVKAMVFPVVVYECENWTIKKAECQRIDAFKFWNS